MDLAVEGPIVIDPGNSEIRVQKLRLPAGGGVLNLRRPPSVDALLERMDLDAPGAEDRIPYWAELWPSADAMIRWLLEGGAPVRPGRALEIGCGLGLVGMAALRAGWTIDLTDRDPAAVDLLRANLAANGLDPRRARVMDWDEPPAARYDTILAADILYEKVFAGPLLRFFDRALAPGGRAYLAEPGRPVSEVALNRFREVFGVKLRPLRARVDGRWRALRLVELRRS